MTASIQHSPLNGSTGWHWSTAFSLMLASLLLTACGGGGDSSGGASVTAEALPPCGIEGSGAHLQGCTRGPRLPLAPTPPDLSGPLGLTQLSDFPTLGFAYRYTYTLNSDLVGLQLQGPSTPDPTEIVSFSYFAADQTYQITIPGFERERLALLAKNGSGSTYALGTTPRPLFSVWLARPGSADPQLLPLDYTSFGSWEDSCCSVGTHSNNTGYFAYGVPTDQGDVPLSGIRTYKAVVSGATSASAPMYVWWVWGTANLTFDFSKGALTGNLSLDVNPGGPGWGHYGNFPFVSTNYTVGATRFSGKFSMPGGVEDGFFEGQFTGPQASELMVRWLLPQSPPNVGSPGSLFGVLVGKRAND